MGKNNSEKHKNFGKNKKKRKRTTSSSNSSISSIDEEIKRKLKKKIKKIKKKEKRKKKEKKALKLLKNEVRKELITKKNEEGPDKSLINEILQEKSKSLAPMTKEEWEKQQNTFTRIIDKETGRTRLIKGTGEIVEECVSKKRHLAINKQATKGDGEYFQKQLTEKILRKNI